MSDAVIVTTPEPDENGAAAEARVAEAEAAEAAAEATRASAAASVAEAAAASTVVNAETVAAQVSNNAADVVAQYQQELVECRNTLASVIQRQDEYSQEITHLQSGLSELRASLTPPVPQVAEGNPENPSPSLAPNGNGLGETSGETSTAAVTQVLAEPAAEPPKPERKRAHRWI